MFLFRKTNQYRRDFSGVLQCESCNSKQNLTGGYDDTNFYDNVIPRIKCISCNKSSKDIGSTITTSPNVPANVVM